jgi:hypothetical protein
MTGLPTVLFNALVDALKASPALTAVVGDRIYDVPPAKPVTPYVFFGPAGITDARDIGCSDAWRFRIRIYVSTSDHGRLAAWDAAFAICLALHETLPPIAFPGFHMPMPVMVITGGDLIDPTKLKETFVDIDAVIAADPTN